MNCSRCGAKDVKIKEFYYGNEFLFSVAVCDSCWEKAWEEFEERRITFDTLIASGVSNVEANRYMIGILESRSN